MIVGKCLVCSSDMKVGSDMNCQTCKASCVWVGKEKSEHGKCLVGYVPKTNADRIRSMTDEEIADFLCDIGECDRRCPAKIGDCIFSDSTCRIAWLEWLKEGAGET